MPMRRTNLTALLTAAALLGAGAVGAAPAFASHGETVFFEAPRDLLGVSATTQAATFKQRQSLGVRALRVVLYWRNVAPNPNHRQRPNFNQANPAAYQAVRGAAFHHYPGREPPQTIKCPRDAPSKGKRPGAWQRGHSSERGLRAHSHPGAASPAYGRPRNVSEDGHHPLLGGQIAAPDPLAELDLLLRREQAHLRVGGAVAPASYRSGRDERAGLSSQAHHQGRHHGLCNRHERRSPISVNDSRPPPGGHRGGAARRSFASLSRPLGRRTRNDLHAGKRHAPSPTAPGVCQVD